MVDRVKLKLPSTQLRRSDPTKRRSKNPGNSVPRTNRSEHGLARVGGRGCRGGRGATAGRNSFLENCSYPTFASPSREEAKPFEEQPPFPSFARSLTGGVALSTLETGHLLELGPLAAQHARPLRRPGAGKGRARSAACRISPQRGVGVRQRSDNDAIR